MDEVLEKYDKRMYKLVLYTSMYYYVDLDKSYSDNILKLVETLKSNPTGLVTSLSVRTYYYLHEALNMGAANKYLREGYHEDDFDLLVSLNVVDTHTHMINPIYHDIISTIINMPITKSFAYMISVIKGMVDTYGIVNINNIDKVLSSFVKNDKFNATYLINNSSLLKAYCVIEDGMVYHRVLSNEQRSQIIQFRAKNLDQDLQMKMFKPTEYISFACSYNLDKVKPYLTPTWFNIVFEDKRFSLELYVVKHLYDDGIIGANVANKLEEINKYYPKWALNGYSVQEYYDHQNKKKDK